ncbi:MAG: hypothetical protein VX083_17590 [Pseudomonadota bacterium]|nr:hypothetical protein [Pseudomonadota bacterium]
MSDTHIVKAQRHALRDLLDNAALTVVVDQAHVPVTILRRPPAGLKVAPEKLPAVYIYNNGEQIAGRDLQTVDRTPRFEIVMLAADKGDPQDQLDDLQLLIERTILGSDLLSGTCHAIDLEATNTVQEAGRVLYGVRSLSYRLLANVTAGDPSL